MLFPSTQSTQNNQLSTFSFTGFSHLHDCICFLRSQQVQMAGNSAVTEFAISKHYSYYSDPSKVKKTRGALDCVHYNVHVIKCRV